MENMHPENNIIYLTKQLSKLLSQDFDKRLSEFGLTSHQGHILFFINKKVRIDGIEIHQKDIEEEFHLSKSTVSGLIKRMEKRGLIIKKEIHPYYVLEPSKEAIKIIDEIHNGKEETINLMLKGFDENERERIYNNLLKMINNMKGEQ